LAICLRLPKARPEVVGARRMARCACEITSYYGQRVRGAEYASRVGVRSAGWRLRLRAPSERLAAEQAAAAGQTTAAKVTAKVTAKVAAVDTAQKRARPSAAISHGAIATADANGGVKRGQAPPDRGARVVAPLEVKAPAEAKVPLEGKVPPEVKAPLETQVKALLQAGAPAEARALLLAHAETSAPLTQFYLAVCVSQLEGEAAACELYEACLLQRPAIHAARNNLIRGLLQRRTPAAFARAAEHAEMAARLQPGIAEMRYQLGVVYMQSAQLEHAEAAFAAALTLDPEHRGALVNGK
jgi:hypothetical protein